MASKKKQVFPAALFVRYEEDGDESFLLCEKQENDVVSNSGDATEYAVYELTEVRKARQVITLERVE